jgi:hypothetical protein
MADGRSVETIGELELKVEWKLKKKKKERKGKDNCASFDGALS